MDKPVELSGAEARRIALVAQGFGRPRVSETPTVEHVRQVTAALGAVQIDAVNVLVRSHYLALYSRLGSYPAQLVDQLVYQKRAAFEYWGHAASILPIELQPAMRWRMARHAQSKQWAAFQARVEKERPGYLATILEEITERGPLAFGDLTNPARREKVPTKYADSSLLWYRWSDGKTALEGLFDSGRLAAAGRRGFERLYDLTERVVPAEVLAQPTPAEEEGQRAVVRHAVAALGVANVRDVADYFRLPIAVTRARLRELIQTGDVRVARVAGWLDTAYLHPSAKAHPVPARALLSPFDSLIWERTRTQRLFGFQHVFELYVKAPNRRYGYYVLPFLRNEAIVARVDLKADRQARTLRVLGAFVEPGAPGREVAGELAAELHEMATWLGLDAVDVGDRGDLAADLSKAIR